MPDIRALSQPLLGGARSLYRSPGLGELSAGQYAALAEISLRALEGEALETLLTRASGLCGEAAHCSRHAIFRRTSAGRLELQSGEGWSGRQKHGFPGEGDAGQRRSGRLTSDLPIEMGSLVTDFLRLEGVRTGVTVSVPLPGVGSFAALGVYDPLHSGLARGTRRLLGAVAQVLSAAADRRLIETVMRKEIDERTRLSEIAQVVLSSNDITDVFGLLAAQVKGLIPFDYLGIWMARQAGLGFDVAAAAGAVGPGWDAGAFVDASAVPAVELLLAQGATVHHFNAAGHPSLAALATGGSVPVLLVPLVWKGELSGLLTMATKLPGGLHSASIRMADRIAAQISGAVANSRVLHRIERNALSNATVAAISRMIDSSPSLAGIFEDIAAQLGRALRFDSITVLLIDADGSQLRPAYFSKLPDPLWNERQSMPPGGTSFGAVMASGFGRVFAVASSPGQDEQFPELGPGIRAGLCSTLMAPMSLRGRAIGVIVVRSMSRDGYALEDIGLVQRVAVHLADSVGRQRLTTRLEMELRQQSALAELGIAVTEVGSLTALLDTILRGTSSLVGFDRMAIDLIDTDRHELMRAFDSDRTHRNATEGQPPPAVATGTLLDLEEKLSSSREPPSEEEVRTLRPILRSRMQSPLRSRGNLIGRLIVWSRAPEAYEADDLDLLKQAAAQVAPAIENIRSYEMLEREVRERHLLAEIGRAMGSSLEIDDVYQQFATLVRMLVPFDRIAISRYDTKSGNVTDAYQDGVVLPDRPLGLVRPFAGSPGEDLLRRGRGMRTDLRAEEMPLTGYKEMRARMTGAGLWSRIDVPLTFKDNVIASMCVASRQAAAYTDRDLDLVERVASQVAGAIANAELYARVAAYGTAAIEEKSGLPHRYGTSQPTDSGSRNEKGPAHLDHIDQEVLERIARGMTNEEIARELNFAVGTVKNRVARIYRMLGVSNRAEAVAFAVRNPIGTL